MIGYGSSELLLDVFILLLEFLPFTLPRFIPNLVHRSQMFSSSPSEHCPNFMFFSYSPFLIPDYSLILSVFSCWSTRYFFVLWFFSFSFTFPFPSNLPSSSVAPLLFFFPTPSFSWDRTFPKSIFSACVCFWWTYWHFKPTIFLVIFPYLHSLFYSFLVISTFLPILWCLHWEIFFPWTLYGYLAWFKRSMLRYRVHYWTICAPWVNLCTF